MYRFRAAIGIALLTLSYTPLLAQGDPWADGELIIRSRHPVTWVSALYRVEPETGYGEELITGFYWLGGPGSMAFDSYRQKFLGNMALPPDNLQVPELWLVDHDGSAQKMPGFNGVYMRAMAPVGDGRVYFQPTDFSPNPADEIHYLDASDQVHVLMDATGAAPLDFHVETMLYDADSNSLFAATSEQWSPNDCVAGQSSIFRIPLSADGSQVAGAIACGGLGYDHPVQSLDRLPGGDLLVQMEGFWADQSTIRRVDPVTLTDSTWSKTEASYIDAGLYSARIGKAIILDGWQDELRSFGAGENGEGTLITSNVSVSPSSGGSGPAGLMIEVDLNGPSCAGATYAFGQGLAGTGGAVPSFFANGCPDVGSTYTVTLDDVVGGAPGLMIIGLSATNLPLQGGTLYVVPATTLVIAANGTPGVAGDGGLQFSYSFTNPAYVGLDFFLQAAFVDSGAVFGVSLTNALQIAIG